MSTLSEPPVAAPSGGDRFLLSGIEWDTYVRLRDELDRAGRKLKLTYDNGMLEIEMPLEIHELIKAFVSQMLEAYLNELEMDYIPTGATTWKQMAKKKGLEADESYYVTSYARVTEGQIDITRDPPPDIAIEIEVTVPLLPKLPVYAGIGVPEVWHITDDGSVEILRLSVPGAEYEKVDASRVVPYFNVTLINQWVKRRDQIGHAAALREFRKSLLPP